MQPRTARILVIASAVVLLATVAALVLWPRSEPRADLIQATPIVSSTVPSTTTTTAPATSAPTTTTTTTLPPSPGSVWIPAIGLVAPVVPVGQNPDGSMEVPAASEVGWYEPGVRPGAPEGSAVLAAHVDYAGEKGAFFDLRSVPEGAEVIVVGADGVQQRFVVNARFQVDKDALPGEELFRSNGPTTLTLITCGGAFDRGARSYRDNIIVRAVPPA